MSIITETLFSENETANSKQIAILKKKLPQCFDKNGDFLPEKIAEIIQANNVDMVKESYSLNWLGKSYARLLTNLPPQKLMTSDIAHNELEKNKNSKNVLIKGDNLEVLKQLANAYRESVKMIYIDPPYNTGSDEFVYQDDFSFTSKQLSELTGIDKDEADRILEFTAKGSNSHSAWLTFMYPRLYIARELLKDEGIVFISIDDHEQAQLKLLCDEVFGEENFIASLPWKGRGGGADDKRLLQNHEYILMYSKDAESFTTGRKIKEDEKFPKFDEEKNRHYKTQLARKWGSNSRREDRPNLFYSVENKEGVVIYPKLPNGKDGCWRWKKSRLDFAIENNDVEYNKRDSDDAWEVYEKIYEPLEGEFRTKLYSSWLQDEIYDELLEILDDNDPKNTAFGTKEVKSLFNGSKVFSYPKPTTLISILMKIGSLNNNDIVLDFFAGSGTTADAVMQLNAEDNGNRQFVIVQIDAPTDSSEEAYKLGYKTIFDITQARIEKAGQKIEADYTDYRGDLGFKIYQTTEDFRVKADDTLVLNNLTLFDDVSLTDEQYQSLLTTWMLYDDSKLTEEVSDIILDGYTAHLCKSRLYLIAPDFTIANITALLERLDSDKDFAPNKIVIYGSNFDSVNQMELNEALKSYGNKKSIDISLLVRY
ncbi:DNA methyltransferase [Psychrobacter sp. TWP2-1-2]|uniref:site-specific DNA-methyltransferase n=1 Tax=Psychrobacter sp. TWP2-1-2 TaxID=2804623 RepID=UPI003CE780FA